MIHFELQRLLQANCTLDIQLSERTFSLKIQMNLVNEQIQTNSLVNKLLIMQSQWRKSQANNLLNLQQKLLFRAQRLEHISRYQRIIEELMWILNNKQKQIAFHENEGKPFKRAGVSIDKLIYQQDQSGIGVLLKELKIKDELQKQISELQINLSERQDPIQNIDKLQFTLLEKFMSQQNKNKKLKQTYRELCQQIKTLDNNSVLCKQSNGNRKEVITSIKTISQTSDQD